MTRIVKPSPTHSLVFFNFLSLASRALHLSDEELCDKQFATSYPSRFRYTLNFAQYPSLSNMRPWKRYFRFDHGTSMDMNLLNDTEPAHGWINAINERLLRRFQAGIVLTLGIEEAIGNWGSTWRLM